MNIACLSGGLDSSTMYLYLTGYLTGTPAVEDITGVFTDTHMEHPRTYRMLDTLEALTGRPIMRLAGPTWEDALEVNAWFLPWHRARWCTPTFKIRPFEAYIAGQVVTSYIGLRADEPERTGYLGDRGSNVTPRYPLRELGWTRADVERVAKEAGLPKPASWSCGCCPFKNVFTQLQMIEELPEMAEWMAWVEDEKQKRGAGAYTWIRGYTMRELIDSPVLRAEIRRRWWARHHADEQMGLFDEPDEAEQPCIMCRVK